MSAVTVINMCLRLKNKYIPAPHLHPGAGMLLGCVLIRDDNKQRLSGSVFRLSAVWCDGCVLPLFMSRSPVYTPLYALGTCAHQTGVNTLGWGRAHKMLIRLPTWFPSHLPHPGACPSIEINPHFPGSTIIHVQMTVIIVNDNKYLFMRCVIGYSFT